MKATIKIEIDDEAPEQIIIRCHKLDQDVMLLQRFIESGNVGESQMPLKLNGREYFIKYSSILFFETAGKKIAAHTVANMYYTDKTLRELTSILPCDFMRVSKSCILNLSAV